MYTSLLGMSITSYNQNKNRNDATTKKFFIQQNIWEEDYISEKMLISDKELAGKYIV